MKKVKPMGLNDQHANKIFYKCMLQYRSMIERSRIHGSQDRVCAWRYSGETASQREKRGMSEGSGLTAACIWRCLTTPHGDVVCRSDHRQPSACSAISTGDVCPVVIAQTSRPPIPQDWHHKTHITEIRDCESAEGMGAR